MTHELLSAAGKLRDYGAGVYVGFLTAAEVEALKAAGAKPCWNSKRHRSGQPWYCRLRRNSAVALANGQASEEGKAI